MTEPTLAQDLFKGRHFDQEIIILCVRWYITFKLRALVQISLSVCFGLASGLSLADRQLLRLEKAKPLLEQIKIQIQTARSDALPKSVLAKACNYTLTAEPFPGIQMQFGTRKPAPASGRTSNLGV